MSRDLTQTWSALLSPTNRSVLSRNEQREYGRELATVHHDGDLAEAMQDVITSVASRAHMGAIQTNRLRETGEQIAPSGAMEYALVEMAATEARVAVIRQLGRR
jgi:hypothetical protein